MLPSETEGDGESSNVADYFMVIGLPEDLSSQKEIASSRQPPVKYPITSIALIFPSQGEALPKDWECIRYSPSGFPADLNTNALRGQSVYLCYKRATDFRFKEQPLTDIGVLYEGREELQKDCEQLHQSYYGRPGYVSVKSAVGGQRTYITCRRRKATDEMPILAITDIAVIFPKKGDQVPHSFLVVNKNINKGSLTAAEVYLCYKLSIIQPPSLVYEPRIMSRFPLHDTKQFSLSIIERDCANIAMPNGASIQYWDPRGVKNVALPKFSTFILTNHLGVTMYGSALTFYEDFEGVSKLSESQISALKSFSGESGGGKGTDAKPLSEADLAVVPFQCEKCICLLSRKPLFEAFKDFLNFLYSFCFSRGDRGPIPVERFISFFMYDVSCPSIEKPLIMADFGARKIELTWPSPCSSLPQRGSSFSTLLRNTGWENAIDLFALVLVESRIVFHSLRPAILTTVMETLCGAIFPLKWTGTYIPRCAREMVTSAECPGCALIGIDSQTYDALDYYDLLSPEGRKQICFVDLDTVQILLPEDKKNYKAEKILPKKAYKYLKKILSDCHREIDTNPQIYGARGGEFSEKGGTDTIRKKIYTMELRCQEAFLKFMAMILKGYQNFLRVGIEDVAGSPESPTQPKSGFYNFSDLFDLTEFLKFHKSNKQFYSEFCSTHSFAHFIHLRSHVNNYSASMEDYTNNFIVFFDQCTEKDEDAHLLEVDKSFSVEHCKFITPPEPKDPSLNYNYGGIFPTLDPTLFGDCSDDVGGFSRSSLTTSNNPSLLATPVHSLKSATLNGNPSAGPGIWRTPAEKKAAQSNAKDLYQACKKPKSVSSISVSVQHANETGATAAVQAKQWVSYLHINCYSMWYMLLPAFVSYKSHQEYEEVLTVIAYAENLLNDMLAKFVSKQNSTNEEPHLHSTGATTSTAPVMPEEVCYRVLIYVFHKYSMLDKILHLQQTLKKHGIKLNAGTYSYLNSMRQETRSVTATPQSVRSQAGALSAAAASSVKFEKRKRDSKYHWCIVYCSAKFIILHRKVRSRPSLETDRDGRGEVFDENLETSSHTLEEKREMIDLTHCSSKKMSGDVDSKPDTISSNSSSSHTKLDEHMSRNNSASHHRRNLSLFATGDLDQFSSNLIKRKQSASSAQNVNRKLFSNSQLSLTSEHEVSSSRMAPLLAKRPQYSSVGDALEHRDSTENCPQASSTIHCDVDVKLKNISERSVKRVQSSANASDSSMNSISERVPQNQSNNDAFKNSILQLSSIASKDNVSEELAQDTDGSASSEAALQLGEPDAQLSPETNFLLPRSDSTRSSFERDNSLSALHRRAVNYLAAAKIPFSQTAQAADDTPPKASRNGSTSTISEDPASSSSNLAILGLGFGGRNGSSENILSYTQKVLNNSTAVKLKDKFQQIKEEVKYAVSVETAFEPDLEAIKKENLARAAAASASQQPTPQKSNKPQISAKSYKGRFRRKVADSLVSVEISSVYTCVNPTCQKVLYDEDIMAQWNNDDSNFSIRCPCVKGVSSYNSANASAPVCDKAQLPKLTIILRDHRPQYLQCGCESCLRLLDRLCPEYLEQNRIEVHDQNRPRDVGDFSHRITNVPDQQLEGILIDSTASSASQSSLADASYSNCDEHSLNSTAGTAATRTIEETLTPHKPTQHTPTSPAHENNNDKLDVKQSDDSDLSENQTLCAPKEIGPIVVNYLSPLVVRKALEKLLDNSNASYDILQSPDMVDEKTDIYWNLVWYFNRMGFRTHLNDLLLKSKLLQSQSALEPTSPVASSTKQAAGSLNRAQCIRRSQGDKSPVAVNPVNNSVQVNVLWDKLVRTKQHKGVGEVEPSYVVPWETEAPLFLSWVKHDEASLHSRDELDSSAVNLPDRWKPELAKDTFDAIFGEKDMEVVMRDMLTYLTKHSKQNFELAPNPNRRALHREMLFIAIAALQHRRINIKAFYEAYGDAYRRVKENTYYDSKLLSQDMPPSALATEFAAQFGTLGL